MTQTDEQAIHFKLCPFCSRSAHPIQLNDGFAFLVECTGCKVRSPTTYPSVLAAAGWWNQRAGTPSAFGGRATRGISTKRKRASSRRNLRRARWVKKCRRLADRFELICLLRDCVLSRKLLGLLDTTPKELKQRLIEKGLLFEKQPDLFEIYLRVLPLVE